MNPSCVLGFGPPETAGISCYRGKTQWFFLIVTMRSVTNKKGTRHQNEEEEVKTLCFLDFVLKSITLDKKRHETA